jgi:hypothetical protein
MFISHHQTTGQNSYIKESNKFFENVAKSKYLGRPLTNQNFIHKEIKSRINSGIACYHAVQNLLFSHLGHFMSNQHRSQPDSIRTE